MRDPSYPPAPPAPLSSDDSLEDFLTTTGRFFGKDPTVFTQAGQPQVQTREEGGRRFIESTGVFSGFELHMFVEPLLYDERWAG